MENRFTFKDFIYVSFMTVLTVSVWLAMKQYDRQWNEIQRIGTKVDQQTTAQSLVQRELGELRDRLDRGVRLDTAKDPIASSTGHPADQKLETDPFQRLRSVKQNPTYARGDWLIDAFHANVARITPLVSADAYGAAIQDRVLESLLMRDPVTLEWQPLLARSWSVSDDGLTISFKLRRGITFADGHPVTTEDVTFTFDLINNPKIDAPAMRHFFDKIESVTAPDPHTVVFQLKESYFQALGLTGGMNVLPKHFYGQFDPQEFNRKPGLLLGSGPYRMESPTDWTPGKPLVLVRNDRYWGEPAAFDRLIYREMTNDVARLTAFRNGEIDLFGAMPEQYIKLIKDEQILAQSQSFKYEQPTAGYGFIAWNQRRDGHPTVFADQRVRQAMTMLTDRERIGKEILMGYGIIPSGPFNRLSKQHDSSVEAYPYDEAGALSLLSEAEVADRDGDGVLETPDGKPFRFKHTYPAGGGATGFWDRVSLFLKDSYARVGIVLEPDPLEWAVFKEKLQTRTFDAISLAWGGGLETDIRQMFHSSQIADGANNFTNYANPELDRLIDGARRTVVEDKRMPLWQTCHRILHEDQPYTFLYSRMSLIFIDHRIQNVQRIRIGLNDRTEWYVPRPQQKYVY